MTPKQQTPRDPQLYDYAAARVAAEEADAALAARTAKTARQRLRIMRAAALAGALPATVDPDAAATVAHLSDRLAGRRRVAPHIRSAGLLCCGALRSGIWAGAGAARRGFGSSLLSSAWVKPARRCGSGRVRCRRS